MADEKPVNEDQPKEEELEELSEYEKGEGEKKKIIYLAVFAVQIIVAIFLVYFFLIPWFSGSGEDISAEQQQESEQEEEQQQPKEIGSIYTLPTLTVNPKGSRGRRFAVFEIAFSVQEDVMIEDIKKYEPVLIDNFIRYFRSKTVADLAADTVMSVIKNDIMRISVDIIGEDKINDIFFTNFILQ